MLTTAPMANIGLRPKRCSKSDAGRVVNIDPNTTGVIGNVAKACAGVVVRPTRRAVGHALRMGPEASTPRSAAADWRPYSPPIGQQRLVRWCGSQQQGSRHRRCSLRRQTPAAAAPTAGSASPRAARGTCPHPTPCMCRGYVCLHARKRDRLALRPAPVVNTWAPTMSRSHPC